MFVFLRFILTCVTICVSKCVADTTKDLANIDIANLTDEFRTTLKKNYNLIEVSDESRLKGKHIGKVSDGSLEIVGEPDRKVTHRYVKLIKYHKTRDENPDLEEAVLDYSDDVDDSEPESNYNKTVEVHTFFSDIMVLDRYIKENNEYKKLQFDHVDIDICDAIGETYEISGIKYLKVERFKTIGTIKCGERILLDDINVFYRTVEVDHKIFKVTTVPKYGLISDVTFNRVDGPNKIVTQWVRRVQLSLKLDQRSPMYTRMLSQCGNDCTFYDGCNEKHTLISVQDGETILHSDPNTLCLSVKVEEVREDKYVTIFDRQRNSNYYIVKVFKKARDATGYVPHTKYSINMDVTNDPKPLEEAFNSLIAKEQASPNVRYRIKDNDYRIGAIYQNGQVILEDSGSIFTREIYASEKGVVIVDQYYNGESNRYMFRPTASGATSGTKVSRMGQEIKQLNEYVLKVDLNNIAANVIKYFTQSNENLFVKTGSFVEKLGTLTYNNFMVSPNRFYVSSQFLIMGDKQVKLYSLTRKGYSIYEAFVRVDSFFEGDSTFVSKGKDPIRFDIMDFYDGVINSDFADLKDFDLTYLGYYYLVGIRHNYVYTKIIGSVVVANKIIVPLDTDITSRHLILPENTQSFIIVKDCDFSDCWHRTFKESSGDGEIRYEIQQKTPVDLEIKSVYKNDRGNPYYTFDNFTVYKHGEVYTIRIINDLTHKIGRLLFNGTVVLENDDHVFTRMVNLSVDTNNNEEVRGEKVDESITNNAKVKGNLRVLEIEMWDKSTKLYTYEIENNNFKKEGKEKKDFELDIEPLVRKNTILNITERDRVLSYHLSWNIRDDYKLSKIQCSYYESKNWNPTTLLENLQNFPVYVRLHKDDYESQKNIVVAVENQHGLERPQVGQSFKLLNAVNSGYFLRYNVSNKSAKQLSKYSRDSYYRRNFTEHRHKFKVDALPTPEEQEEERKRLATVGSKLEGSESSEAQEESGGSSGLREHMSTRVRGKRGITLTYSESTND